MLFNHLLTGRAQIFSDVRTYWSPEAVKRVTGKELTGRAAGGIIHLINSGATTLDGSGAASDAEGNPIMKHFWEMTDEDVDACLKATTWYPANRDYFRGGGFSSNFLTRGGMPVTMVRLNHVKGLGPVLQLAEGWTVDVDPEIHKILDKRTDPTWPTTWFAPRLTGKAPTSSLSAQCSASRFACTTWRKTRSSVPLHGTHSVWTRRELTSALARTTDRFTSKFIIDSSELRVMICFAV